MLKSKLYFSAITLGAYVDFKQIVVKPNMTSGKSLQSDAVFTGIKERVAENEAKAKAINAVYLYKITDAGKVAKEWGKSWSP